MQRKAHVLEYALSGLAEQELRVLHTVAAFRLPTVFPTLAALLVGDDRPCATQAELDQVLTDLEDRGLLGWDRVSNRYDLHPVVRGVAWSSLDPDARHGIDLRLADHLGEAPEVDDTAVTCVDDLSNAIELYHTLVRLGRLKGAFELLDDHIVDPLVRLGGYRYLAELARIVIEDPDWLQKIVSEGDFDHPAVVPFAMGIGYQLAGDPVRALDSYDLFPQDEDFDVALIFKSMPLDQRGCLAEAERCARAALARTRLPGQRVGIAIAALGSVLLHRGYLEVGTAWLTDYRVKVDVEVLGYFSLYELGWAALRQGDVLTAQTFANKLDSLASATKRGVHVGGCAALLRGAVAGQLGDGDRAGELLSGALVDARQAGLGELEIIALTQLAEWHLRGHRLPEARGHARDAVELAERAELRLRWADALNVLSRVEQAVGDAEAAAQAAREAYLKAWCDGPPFSYAAGLDEARANLSAVGVQEPAGLVGFQPGEPFPEGLIEPTPPSVLLASLRTDEAPSQNVVVAMIEKLGWTAVDPAVASELDAILGSDVVPPIRAAALRVLIRIEADDERGRERIQRAARDQATEVRVAALSLLDHQADPQATTIIRAFAERDPAKLVRKAALPLLAEHDSDEAFTVICRIAEHDDESEVRLRALEALVTVPDGIVKARPTLLSAVEADPTGHVRSHAAELVMGLEPGAHDALLRRRACEDDDPEVRAQLLMLLAGARWTRLWESLWHCPSPTAVPRVAATIALSADVKSFLLERASSDLNVGVRAMARLLLAASHPGLPPGVLLRSVVAMSLSLRRSATAMTEASTAPSGRSEYLRVSSAARAKSLPVRGTSSNSWRASTARKSASATGPSRVPTR